MFVPLSDDNPLRRIRFQFVTVGLVIANVVVFLLQSIAPDQQFISSFAIVPTELFQAGMFGGQAPVNSDLVAIPERLTLLSYMFFHGDIMHLVGNMLFLWVFGDNVEDAMGHASFLLFYLLCGVAAGMAHALMLPESPDALIGASGAVAGVIAAYLMLHPRVRVWVLAFKFIPLRISAAVVLGIWIALQIVMVVLPQSGPIAWWAHIGGLIAGAVLIVVMRKSDVPLFDR